MVIYVLLAGGIAACLMGLLGIAVVTRDFLHEARTGGDVAALDPLGPILSRSIGSFLVGIQMILVAYYGAWVVDDQFIPLWPGIAGALMVMIAGLWRMVQSRRQKATKKPSR
ncbi:MAG: hypothetical protein ACT4P5_02120 [Armatimonadota bacterium]